MTATVTEAGREWYALMHHNDLVCFFASLADAERNAVRNNTKYDTDGYRAVVLLEKSGE